jgi:hypothetical protein
MGIAGTKQPFPHSVVLSTLLEDLTRVPSTNSHNTEEKHDPGCAKQQARWIWKIVAFARGDEALMGGLYTQSLQQQYFERGHNKPQGHDSENYSSSSKKIKADPILTANHRFLLIIIARYLLSPDKDFDREGIVLDISSSDMEEERERKEVDRFRCYRVDWNATSQVWFSRVGFQSLPAIIATAGTAEEEANSHNLPLSLLLSSSCCVHPNTEKVDDNVALSADSTEMVNGGYIQAYQWYQPSSFETMISFEDYGHHFSPSFCLYDIRTNNCQHFVNVTMGLLLSLSPLTEIPWYKRCEWHWCYLCSSEHRSQENKLKIEDIFAFVSDSF